MFCHVRELYIMNQSTTCVAPCPYFVVQERDPKREQVPHQVRVQEDEVGAPFRCEEWGDQSKQDTVATEVGARAGREDEVGSPPSVLNTRPLTDRQHLLTELANTSDNDTRTRILQQLHALTRHRQSQLDPKT